MDFIRKEEYNEREDENLNKNKVKRVAIIKGEGEDEIIGKNSV